MASFATSGDARAGDARAGDAHWRRAGRRRALTVVDLPRGKPDGGRSATPSSASRDGRSTTVYGVALTVADPVGAGKSPRRRRDQDRCFGDMLR
jgi:hypothetical protein